MMGLASLGGYFDNLAASATDEKDVLEELVTNLPTLTTRNSEMEATIKKITGDNRRLNQQLNRSKICRKKNRVLGKPAACPNCKQEFWHKPADCFEL